MDPREMIGGAAGGQAAAAAASHAHTHQQHPSAAAAAAAASSSRSHHSQAPPIPQALPRELALLKSQLRWDASEPLAPAMPTPHRESAMKAKRVRAVSWRLLPIRSSARTARTGGVVDDLDLMHWVKIHNVPDYRFARFNKKLRMMDYTHEEYEQYLTDPTWSRAETDRLMELAAQYDLRFIIMEDRYNAPAEAAQLERLESKLAPVEHKSLNDLLHPPSPAQEAAQQAEQHAATSVTLAPNMTMSTHPTPVVAAEPKGPNDTAAAAAAAAAATTGGSGDTAATATAADSATAAPAAVPDAAAASAAASSADPSTIPASAASAPAAGDAAATASAAAPTATTAPAAAATVAAAAVPAVQSVPALPPSALSPPSRTTAVPSTSRNLVFPYRSVEHLKSRYYFIQQTLASLRNASDPDLRKSNPLFTHPYDVTHEILRKAQLERLYQRSVADTDAMAEMVLEHRQVQATIKRIKKGQKEERDVARGIKQPAAAGGSSTKSGGRDRKGDSSRDKHRSQSSTQRRPLAQPLVGEMAPLPPQCDASSVLPPRPQGVFLRSQQLNSALQLSSRQSKYLDSELNTLQVKKARDCSVATGVVCDLWDKLRVNVLTLANLTQYVREREIMRDDLRVHSSAGTGAAAAAGLAASQQYQANLAQAAALAQRKKVEKRKMEGEGEQDDKRARKGK